MAVAHQYVGVDIGGTRIKAVRVTGEGEVLDKRLALSVNDRDQLLQVVDSLIQALAPESGVVGICAPGLAATDNRSIAWMRGRMQAVEGLDWGELGKDAWVLNDAHAATLGEAWIGAARDRSHVVLLTLGTGVGGGVIVDGRLLQGATGRAGHLGHISINAAGARDIVGIPGSLEDAIGDHNVFSRTNARYSSTFDLVGAIKRADLVAENCWRASIRALAVAVASLINAFDPEIVVLGGGIAECGPLLFEPLAVELSEIEWRPFGESVPIVPAQLGDLAGALGAARFAALRAQEL